MTRIAVLATCHDRRDKTLACMAALFNSAISADVELAVFLTDDGSTDGTASAVRGRFPAVEIIEGDGGLYWNRGMHRAFARAAEIGFDAYLWLNDDTLLYPDAVKSLLRIWKAMQEEDGRSAIVIGSARDPDTGELTYGGLISPSRVRPFRFSLVRPQTAAVECETMNGNCVLIPGDVATVVGNLDPAFEHAMGDIDYGLRARRAGLKIVVMPGYAGSCARNSVAGTFKDRSLSLRRRWKQMMRPKGLPPSSWFVFTRRHAGALWPLHFLWPYLSVALGK